jgi:hypothetical protein
MTLLDLAGILAFLAISLGFYWLGSRMSLFNCFCVLILGILILFTEKSWSDEHVHFSEFFVLIVGLLLYWFGLLAIRTMLQRSVSLSLLRSYAAGTPVQTIKKDIESRLKDAERHNLLHKKGAEYELTGFGRSISSLAAALYRIFRIQE